MAKELTKVTKEFAVLKKTAEQQKEDLGAKQTNYRHHESMNYEASDEITRRVGELKKEGAQGTKLDDYRDDKEIKVILAEVENNKTQLGKLATEFKTLHRESTATHEKLTELHNNLKEEIAARKKKKDRKFFAIDSASLPELEKLEKEVETCATNLRDEVVGYLDKLDFSYDPKKTDTLMEKAVTASPEAREQRDEKAMGNRALDLRVLGRNTKLVQKGREEVKKQLTTAVKEFKENNLEAARDAVDKASEARAEVQKIAEIYSKAIGGMRKHDIESMKQNDDGKKILAATELIAKLDAEAGKELQLILSKLQF